MIEATYICHSGDDLLVVNAARVSFAKRSTTLTNRDRTLLGYLVRHDHWSPFAHPQITIHCRAPIFVRTQCFKHKVGFAENEVSRRYVDDEPELFSPQTWRARPLGGAKQGSAGEIEQQKDASRWTHAAYTAAKSAYDALLKAGVAPEQARMVLPQAMLTEWFWTGSLAAWARFYGQRTGPHAQAEAGVLAELCADIIEPLFPAAWAALIGTGQ